VTGYVIVESRKQL